MRRLVYLAAAERDLLSILEYITRESGSVAIGVAFTDRLQAQCAKLASLTGTLGRARPELRPEIRSSAFGNYVIFFRYGDDTLEVVNILEGHRDIDAFFSKGSTIESGVATTDQKISNWNAERNSSTDFNNNSRAVQGGHGFTPQALATIDAGLPAAQVPDAGLVFNGGNRLGISNALDFETQSMKQLFDYAADCAEHGSLWLTADHAIEQDAAPNWSPTCPAPQPLTPFLASGPAP